ncbi:MULTISPECIES: hypothetical protein [Bacillus]|uniref:hypothetical protein n=1 Tax=Bacillus TaxID=1386 RepID=UPI000D027AB1|nr:MULTISPECIES: hypothetical protein [Bacillus]MBR9654988.1 hypothetical protein [Bacillus cereus]PRP92329.1 hypothetical protein TUN_49630 [Bacillus sp. M21]
MSNKLNDGKSSLSTISYDAIYRAMEEELPRLGIASKNNWVLFAKNLISVVEGVVDKLKPQINENLFSMLEMQEEAIYKNFTSLHFGNTEKECQSLQNLLMKMKERTKEYASMASYNRLNELVGDNVAQVDNGIFSVCSSNPQNEIQFGKLEYNSENDLGRRNILRNDFVQIGYKATGLLEGIKQSFVRLMKNHPELDPSVQEMVIEQIESEGLLADVLYDFIVANRFAAVKRASGFLYLDYLREGISSPLAKKHSDANTWLQRYVERYEQLEVSLTKYLQEARFPTVDLLGTSYDVLNTLRNEDVYSFLPFIGVFSQVMAATHDNDRCVEQYGLHLKLNGEVHNSGFIEGKGKPSFSYHVEKLATLCEDGRKSDYFENGRKAANVLWQNAVRTILLKYFLIGLEDESYNPLITFEKDLEELTSYNGKKKTEDLHAWFVNIAEGFLKNPMYQNGEIEKRLEKIRVLFRELLDPKLSSLKGEIRTKVYKRRMTFFKSILEPKLFSSERNSLLRKELDTHNYKYTILTQDLLEDSLFSFEYEIVFRNTFLCSTPYTESSKFIYRVKPNNTALTVMFLPFDSRKGHFEPQTLEFMKSCPNVNKVWIPYERRNFYKKGSAEDFVYQFVYKLYVYLFLLSYTDEKRKEGKKLFLGFWHFHERRHVKDEFSHREEQIRQYTKELEFVFALENQAGSQGYDFGTGSIYKMNNARNSMYSNIAKRFWLETPIKLPKVAIVVVTSMKTDTRNREDEYYTGVFGEVYTIDSRDNQSIFRRYGTFFDFDNEKIYERSAALVQIMEELSDENYHHVIFIAQTPYTTKFLDKKNAEKELYFMNGDIMESLHVGEHMQVYPMHVGITRAFESHLGKSKHKSGLFVDDTSHIQQHMYRDHKGIIPIFQLYSGNGLKGNAQSHVYNSLITYQTWRQIYSDEVLNSRIQSAVIDPDGHKPDLIRSLLLLHTSRYESSFNITLKVDPYQHLMGDDGVAKKSMVKVEYGSNRYPKHFSINMLAYLCYLHRKVFREEVRSHA